MGMEKDKHTLSMGEMQQPSIYHSDIFSIDRNHSDLQQSNYTNTTQTDGFTMLKMHINLIK